MTICHGCSTRFTQRNNRVLSSGLAICRTIVEKHGGSVSVDKTERGAKVSFTLPRQSR
ncbi:hypothetical protein HGO37_22460 [Rhizobium sp. CG4]|uniref:ATP-binding protein n=1 Tax=unclassified Rhizobium TaxID=2613769 RepID=UPI00331DD5FC|nr:hypothetical protein [Rhizobium sp. CG4]